MATNEVKMDADKLKASIISTPDDQEEAPERKRSLAGSPAMGTEEMVTLPIILVTIKRDLETIVAECFEHELPILKIIHQGGEVEVEDDDYSEGEVPDNAEAELQRLNSKYRDPRFKGAVAAAYPGGLKDLASSAGLAIVKGKTEQPAQSMSKARKPARKQ